ncbi:MAG: MarR family transcriptional regulator [Saprospiraceae bacterium]|nr:MarR family transcriptional regulator [Saprospiraceae bacterium]
MNKQRQYPQDSLIFLTNRVGRLLAAAMRKMPEMEKYKLGPQDIAIMVDLWQKDGLKQQDLAVSTIKDKATITRGLGRLEERNMVVRVPDAQDKRNKRIYLTHLGKEMETELLPLAEKIVAEATKEISSEEVAICKKVLFEIYKQLIG